MVRTVPLFRVRSVSWCPVPCVPFASYLYTITVYIYSEQYGSPQSPTWLEPVVPGCWRPAETQKCRRVNPFPWPGMAGEVSSARPARERLRDLRASCHCTRTIVACIRDCLRYAFVISRVVLCVPVPSAVSSRSAVR